MSHPDSIARDRVLRRAGMSYGVVFVRLVALACAALVLATTVRTAHAMGETYLHSNAVPHAVSALAGLSADAGDTSDDHHHDDDHGGGDLSEAGANETHPGVRHHQHADHNVDTAHLLDQGRGVNLQASERLGVRLTAAAPNVAPSGIERPPRS